MDHIPELAAHAPWAKELLKKCTFTKENIRSILKEEICVCQCSVTPVYISVRKKGRKHFCVSVHLSMNHKSSIAIAYTIVYFNILLYVMDMLLNTFMI